MANIFEKIREAFKPVVLADANETYLVLDTTIRLLIERGIFTEEEFLTMKEQLRSRWER